MVPAGLLDYEVNAQALAIGRHQTDALGTGEEDLGAAVHSFFCDQSGAVALQSPLEDLSVSALTKLNGNGATCQFIIVDNLDLNGIGDGQIRHADGGSDHHGAFGKTCQQTAFIDGSDCLIGNFP